MEKFYKKLRKINRQERKLSVKIEKEIYKILPSNNLEIEGNFFVMNDDEKIYIDNVQKSNYQEITWNHYSTISNLTVDNLYCLYLEIKKQINK